MTAPGRIPLCSVSSHSQSAFSRIDLIAVLATLGLLTILVLPAIASSSASAKDLLCLSNLKKLTLAWHRYAADHGGQLPGNLDGGSNIRNTNQTWCVGWLEYSMNTPDNTNQLNLRNSQLGAYVDDDVSIFHCPADSSTTMAGGQNPYRVRSVSMNIYLGQRAGPYTTGYSQFRSLGDFNALPPGQCFVFLDEREDSINDGAFFVDMAGFDPPNPAGHIMVDYPAGYHDGGAGISFADGHAETWRWKDARTTPVLRPGVPLALAQPSPNNADIDRLQSVTSRKINDPTR